MTAWPNLTAQDVGKRLGVSASVVWKWIRQGLIPFYDLPCGYRFEESEVLEWVLKNKKTPVVKNRGKQGEIN